MKVHKIDKHSETNQNSFAIVNNFLVIALPDNFDDHEVEILETKILNHLNINKYIRGIIIDFSYVSITDKQDLYSLQNCLLATRLLGRKVALCGISPGLASLIVNSGQNLHRSLVGRDIDDVLEQIKKQ